jgi:ABC-type phosphate transport system auxiliary subunit
MDTIDVKQFLSSAETSQEKKELKKLTEEQQKLYLAIEKEQHQLCLAIWALSQAACWADGDKGEEENDETKKIVKSLMGYFSEAQKKSVTENLASFNEKNIKPTFQNQLLSEENAKLTLENQKLQEETNRINEALACQINEKEKHFILCVDIFICI